MGQALPARSKQHPTPRIRSISYYAILASAGLWAASRPVSSGDLWVALGCGRLILEAGIGRDDPFSFTSLPGAWINQNWLTHVLFTLIHRAAGLEGLVLWKVVVSIAITLLVASTARSLGARRSLAAVAGVAAALLGRPFYDVRPNLHSILLAAALLRWLVSVAPRLVRGASFLRTVWPLVLISIAWANLHGGFLVGVFFVAAAAAGLLVFGVLHRKTGLLASRFLALPVIGLGGAFVSPFGWRNLAHPYEVSMGPSAAHWRNVVEWRPPFGPGSLEDPGVRGFWILTAAAAAILLRFALLRHRRRLSRFDVPAESFVPVISSAGIALALCLTSRRFIPFFAVAALPALAIVVARFHATAAGAKESIAKGSRPGAETALVWPILGALALIASGADFTRRLILPNELWSSSVSWAERLVRADEQPEKAVRFVLGTGARGRVFTDWTWGGYLLYRAPLEGRPPRPRYQIYIDGRAQAAYRASISEDYVAFEAAAAARDTSAVRRFLDFHRIDLCILDRRGGALPLLLPEMSDWTGLYADDETVVAARLTSLDRLREGDFPDEAIAQATLAFRLRTSKDLDPDERIEAFQHAVASLRSRPTTTGISEMMRLALGSAEPLDRTLRERAAAECDRILEGDGASGSLFESLTVEANAAQSRAILAKVGGEAAIEREMRGRGRALADRAQRIVRRYLR